MENKHQALKTETDRISNLPESIREKIACFLPIDEAFRTSILSTPWRKVCDSLSILDLDHRFYETKTGNRSGFKDFVSQLLDRRDGSNVQSFNLSVHVDDSIVQYIHSWFSFILQHKVESIGFFVVSGNTDSLPCSLFTCKTLTVLKLESVYIDLPALVKFPVIKVLILNHIVWSDDKQTNRLISSCPLLQKLTLFGCLWIKSNLLVISAPNLEYFVLEPTALNQEVRISSTKLSYCHYAGHPPDIGIESLSSLLVGQFLLHPFHSTTPSASHNRVTKILMGLQNVVDLMLREYNIEILARDWDILSKNSTGFCSVKILGLIVFPGKNQLRFVTSFLKLFSNVQTVCIFLREHYESFPNIEEYCQPRVSSDLGSLEEINICSFKGSDDELYLIRYLLENGKALKIMRIRISKELDEDNLKMNTIVEKIEKFVKAFSVATIFYF